MQFGPLDDHHGRRPGRPDMDCIPVDFPLTSRPDPRLHDTQYSASRHATPRPLRSHTPPPSRSHIRVPWSGPIDNLDRSVPHDASAFLSHWTSGTLLLQGGQIAVWIPTISSAVEVHMEMFHQAPQLPGLHHGLD